MKTKNDKLLPCPFCGSNDPIFDCFGNTQYPGHEDWNYDIWELTCFGCGIVLPHMHRKEDLIKLWNTRSK